MHNSINKRFYKEKVTLTLDSAVLNKIDRWSKKLDTRSRSAAIEQLLIESLADREKRLLEEETKNYYLTCSEEEKSEAKNWAKLSSQQVSKRFS
ncbi:MAG: ribbon-helix-helix protein, CopG family [Deltaproteobacteria bacterium]|nr:ribbon-helix-helix protein, CopG family [Deltaproteobacteria bacterium]